MDITEYNKTYAGRQYLIALAKGEDVKYEDLLAKYPPDYYTIDGEKVCHTANIEIFNKVSEIDKQINELRKQISVLLKQKNDINSNTYTQCEHCNMFVQIKYLTYITPLYYSYSDEEWSYGTPYSRCLECKKTMHIFSRDKTNKLINMSHLFACKTKEKHSG